MESIGMKDFYGYEKTLKFILTTCSYTHRRRNRGAPGARAPPLVRICPLVPPLQTVWYRDLFDPF